MAQFTGARPAADRRARQRHSCNRIEPTEDADAAPGPVPAAPTASTQPSGTRPDDGAPGSFAAVNDRRPADPLEPGRAGPPAGPAPGRRAGFTLVISRPPTASAQLPRPPARGAAGPKRRSDPARRHREVREATPEDLTTGVRDPGNTTGGGRPSAADSSGNRPSRTVTVPAMIAVGCAARPPFLQRVELARIGSGWPGRAGDPVHAVRGRRGGAPRGAARRRLRAQPGTRAAPRAGCPSQVAGRRRGPVTETVELGDEAPGLPRCTALQDQPAAVDQVLASSGSSAATVRRRGRRQVTVAGRGSCIATSGLEPSISRLRPRPYGGLEAIPVEPAVARARPAGRPGGSSTARPRRDAAFAQATSSAAGETSVAVTRAPGLRGDRQRDRARTRAHIQHGGLSHRGAAGGGGRRAGWRSAGPRHRARRLFDLRCEMAEARACRGCRRRARPVAARRRPASRQDAELRPRSAAGRDPV